MSFLFSMVFTMDYLKRSWLVANLCITITEGFATMLLVLQPFCHFTYITAHSPTLLSLYLCHSSFSNPSVASPTSQFILLPFLCFSYITSSSLNSPGEPPMLKRIVQHLTLWYNQQQIAMYEGWNFSGNYLFITNTKLIPVWNFYSTSM